MARTRDLGDMYGYFIADNGTPTYQIECTFCGQLKLVHDAQAWLFCGEPCSAAYSAVLALKFPATASTACTVPGDKEYPVMRNGPNERSVGEDCPCWFCPKPQVALTRRDMVVWGFCSYECRTAYASISMLRRNRSLSKFGRMLDKRGEWR